MTQPERPTQKSYTPAPPDNLARQNPVPNLFDEFTDFVSGELKTLNMKDFEAEHKPAGYPAPPPPDRNPDGRYPDDDPGFRPSQR